MISCLRKFACGLIACLLVGVGAWVAVDPPGALRAVLLVWMDARGIERKVCRGSGLAHEYFEAGADNGRAVLLLHGAGGDAISNWFSFMPSLASGFHVVAPQMGYANLGDVDMGGDFFGLEVNRIEAVLRTAGVDRVYVVGLSVGGWLALRLAAALPHKVAGVVAVAPAGPNLRGLGERMAASGVPPGQWFYDNLFYDPPPIPEFLLRWQYPQVEAWSSALPHYMEMIDSGGAGPVLTLRRVHCPVLVVWGRDDRLLPVVDSGFYSEHLERMRLVTLDSCGHAVVWDQRRRLERLVADFVEGGAL